MEGSHARPSLTLTPGTLVWVPSTSPSQRGRLLPATVMQHLRPDFEVKVRLARGALRFVPVHHIRLR